jgi:hypothetical protein
VTALPARRAGGIWPLDINIRSPTLSRPAICFQGFEKSEPIKIYGFEMPLRQS